jgi:hypothetical protein
MIIKIFYMRLLINGDKLVRDVQQEFAIAYPFLKIEFFRNMGLQNEQALKQNQIKHDQKLSAAKSHSIENGDLLIDDMMSVTDLEKAFMDRFGLRTQVFRRSGNIWLETSITDGWSLKQQNDLGREITTGRKPGDREKDDYDLRRDAV